MKCSYHLYWAENKHPIVPLVSIKHNWTKKNNLQIRFSLFTVLWNICTAKKIHTTVTTRDILTLFRPCFVQCDDNANEINQQNEDNTFDEWCRFS